jgi:hypothetical protein
MTIQPEEEEITAKVIPLKPKLSVITGGRGGSGHDWLSPLRRYSIFLAKEQRSEIDLFEYHVLFIGENSRLLQLVQDGKDTKHWVDPIEFCKRFTCHEIMYEGEESSE